MSHHYQELKKLFYLSLLQECREWCAQAIRPAEALNNQGRRFSYPMQDQRSIEGADLLIPPICQRKSFLRDGR